MATKPFFRRRKSDPFEGDNAPKLHLWARQNRSIPYHRSRCKKPACACTRDQTRTVFGPVALRC